MTDLIRRNDALDILCKSCGITEDVEKCRKTSADGWCKEYCELKNMPTVEAIPVEWIKQFIKKENIHIIHKVGIVYMVEQWKLHPIDFEISSEKCGAKRDEVKEE